MRTLFATIAVACALGAAARAQPAAAPGGSAPAQPAAADESAAREADLFGAPAADASSDAGAREADLFGAPASSAAPATTSTEASAVPAAVALDPEAENLRPLDIGAMDGRLAASSDKLALGARLFMQGQYSQFERDPPDGLTQLQAPTLLDIYLDGRLGDRVRGYARGRLSYDFMMPSAGGTNSFGQQTSPLTVQLDQLYLNFDIAKSVFVTAGKARIKWGAGRFWNPTDFLNRQRLDPLAILDTRLGAGLLKVHVPVPSLGWNLYAVGDLQDATRLDELGGALRAEIVLGAAELAFSAAARKNNPLRVGADISVGVWLLDLKAELALQKGLETPFYRGRFDLATLTLPEEYSRKDDWIPQAVLGAEASFLYSDQDSVYVGAEYFFNDAGYEDASLYTWLLAGTALGPAAGRCATLDTSQPLQQAQCDLLKTFPPPGLFTPLYLGRHYAGLYAMLPNPGDWNNTSFTLAGLANLSDRTGIVRLDYRVLALTFLSVNAYANVHWALSRNGELLFRPEVPASLAGGAVPSIPGPMFELGGALTVSM